MDDMISRRAVLDKFEPWLKVKDYNDGELNMLKAILYEIRFMPPATDKNVGTKLGTNLAEVGTDCISRQQAIDALCRVDEYNGRSIEAIRQLPSAQPEIIYCKDCVKHNKGLGNYEVHPDGSSTWIWKDSACPLVSWRDKAQGHEFDYQFCAYAERREVTE